MSFEKVGARVVSRNVRSRSRGSEGMIDLNSVRKRGFQILHNFDDLANVITGKIDRGVDITSGRRDCVGKSFNDVREAVHRVGSNIVSHVEKSLSGKFLIARCIRGKRGMTSVATLDMLGGRVEMTVGERVGVSRSGAKGLMKVLLKAARSFTVLANGVGLSSEFRNKDRKRMRENGRKLVGRTDTAVVVDKTVQSGRISKIETVVNSAIKVIGDESAKSFRARVEMAESLELSSVEAIENGRDIGVEKFVFRGSSDCGLVKKEILGLEKRIEVKSVGHREVTKRGIGESRMRIHQASQNL